MPKKNGRRNSDFISADARGRLVSARCFSCQYIQKMGGNLLYSQFAPKVRKILTPYMFLLPALILLAVLMFLPIFNVIRYSFLDNVIARKSPNFIGFENYTTIFQNNVFGISLINTLYFTVMSVTFHLLLGLLFALFLNAACLGPIARALFRLVYIMPWVFTATIVAIIWRLILNPNGIINYILISLRSIHENIAWFSSTKTAIHALTFVNIWAGYPFYMVSLLAGLQGVSDELYEAATIDGANLWQMFANITIPHLTPIIISISMLDFIWTMQVFPLVWMTTGGGPIYATEVLSTFTYKLAFSSYKFSLASASAVVILLLSMSLAVFYIKNQKNRL